MADLRAILEGKSINIIVYDEPYKGRYYSAVYKIADDILTVIAPNSNGTALTLPKGLKIAITFWDDIRAYMFETIIVGRLNGHIPTFNVQMPEKMIEIQRRNFVRVPINKKFVFQLLSTEEEENPWVEAITLDLSGGGIRFQTSLSLVKEDALNISLDLQNKQIQTTARVCRVVRDGKLSKNEVAAEFISLSKKDRENIISFLFDIQRKMLKKGLV